MSHQGTEKNPFLRHELQTLESQKTKSFLSRLLQPQNNQLQVEKRPLRGDPWPWELDLRQRARLRGRRRGLGEEGVAKAGAGLRQGAGLRSVFTEQRGLNKSSWTRALRPPGSRSR